MPMWILLVGLLAIVVGVAVALVMSVQIVKERSEVAASLADVAAIGGTPSAAARVAATPFRERVTAPAQARAAGIARALSGGDWSVNTTIRLDRAGNPPNWDVERILATKTMTAGALMVAVGGILAADGRWGPALLWGAVFGGIGFFLPDLMLRRAARRRSEEMVRLLPDTIDLLMISVESGLTFDTAIANVARSTDGPLAEEFSRVLREIQIGSGRSEALRALSDRTDVEDLRGSLNAIIQAETFGIPIADVLRVQSAEIRLKRSQRIEQQAMKLPVKMVFPVMFCIMPALFIVVLGPAVLSIVEQLGS